MSEINVDNILLEKFEQEIWNKIPHLEGDKIVNATPLVNLTNDLKECAKSLYKFDISNENLTIYGKFDANLVSGSIKVRPAIHIMHDAIKTGKLKNGQTIIEATSGNFGIALGQMSKLGLTVISLVSRKLQEGVFKELRDENIQIMDLDMDICPAPGMKDADVDALAAKATAANIRSQLTELGFDPVKFDDSISEVEKLLAAQDIINLAKLISKIYGCFCPEQYDNELNIEAHRTITAVEIDQQLKENGDSLEDYRLLCTFGTGGTSGGLSKYMNEKYGKKAIHVVFPPAGQDVAGIRTKAKADGLKLYNPGAYAAEHETDFEQAKYLLKFFVDKGHNIGESTALALYTILQMLSNGDSGKFLVVVADGIEKYRKNLETISNNQRIQVSLEDATSSVQDYDKIVWVHTQYTPKEEGIEIIAKALGVDKEKITIPKASTIGKLLTTQEIPDELNKELEGIKGKSLLICMAGNTSLMATKILTSKGIVTESLNGGITNLPGGQGKNPGEYIQIARE
ncbi:MAG: pyridoxal-phosphate dependent enzyme [Nitrosopumilus sp.]